MTLALDRPDLERAVGRAVSSYDVEAIDPHLRIHSVTGGVYRVRGSTDEGTAFSLVVKVVRHGVDGTPDGLWLSGADVGHRNYWKREWLAFDSGLLAGLPGRLRAPGTRLTTQTADGDCWVWMDDVGGRTGKALTLDDYRTIGFALGTTQGSYAAGATALPDQPWLSRRWLHGWVEASAPMAENIGDDSVWGDPRLAPLRSLRERAAEVWSRREELLATVEMLPLTVTHYDFWPANVFVTDDGGVIAIDWSQIGLGGLAQDLDQLTLDPVWMQVWPDADPRRLERMVLAGYADGLRASGLDVDESALWQWYAAAAGVRYVPMLGGQPRTAADPAAASEQERRFGLPYATIAANKARAIERAVELGELALGG